ncbi:MAG: S9 family peptidase, partial [Calditrichaeota bacterium]|nr:S9 family peptidase [Calditrichota bacterium]
MRSFSFILLVLCVHFLNAQEKHNFSVHDMLAMDRISNNQVSPDGRQIAFVLRKTDLEANKGRTDIWVVDADGKNLKQLTTDPAGDIEPLWSVDGQVLYFLSSRSGTYQVWKMNRDGSQPVQVTKLPLPVSNLAISPDGLHLAFSMEVFPDCVDLQCSVNRLEEIKNQKSSGIIFDHLFIRHWDTWNDNRRSHVFTMPITGGDVVDVMQQMDADCPSKPFGGAEEFTFTPDSKGIVFTAKDVGRTEAWSTDFDLYYVPLDGSEKPRCLTDENKAWDTQPLFSPDGKTMAYLAMSRPGFEADRYRIVLYSWENAKKRVLTESWDRSPSSFVWSADSKTLYVSADNLGQKSLFAIDAASAKVNMLHKMGTVRSPQVFKNRIFFGMDHLQSPVELYSIKTDGSDLKQITRINAEKMAKVRTGEPEQFTFKGWNDETVYGYVVKPVDFDPTKKYPVAFLIHGGPQGSFGNDFHYRWNPQAYAGAGYAAVMVDFHGSVGYGQDFTDAIRGDWGGKPLVDLQKGLAAALEKY